MSTPGDLGHLTTLGGMTILTIFMAAGS